VIVVSGWIVLCGGMCIIPPGGGVCAIAMGPFAQPAMVVAARRAKPRDFIVGTFP
jgi:hypothetical protein